MKATDKFYIAATDFLLNLLEKNKRLICALFICNLTYLAQIFLMSDVIEGNFGGKIILLPIAICFAFQIFITAGILSALPKIFARVFVVLSAIFFVVDVGTLTLFRSLFDKSMFQILLETNIQEAGEFVDAHASFVAGKIFFAAAAAVILAAALKFCGKFFGGKGRVARFVVIFWLMISTVTAEEIFSTGILFPKDGISVVRMGILIPEAVKEIRDYQEIYQSIDAEKIVLTRNENELPFVVFVLGESTSRGHLEIYGYQNPTTPNLQRRADAGELIIFTDCISAADTTMPSCQRLFTFFGNGGVTDEPWYRFTNIFDILRAAGCYTAWLFNQEFSGIYGNVPRAYADRCDEKKFTTVRDSMTFVYEYDEKILPLLDESLAKNSSAKNFYVLHLLGTHTDYRARYPAEFDIFRPEDEPAKFPFHRQMQAVYDNAVLYNDFIVDEIIRRFEGRDAIVIYTSDHGEDVFDDDITFGHGPGHTERVFEVPLVVWISEACRKNHPATAKKILAAKDKPFMADDMIHALLDLMAVHTADFDSHKSLFSDDFDSTRRRIYDGREYRDGKFFPAGS